MPAIRSSSSWVSPSSMPDRHPRSLSKNQVKPDKDLRRESDSRVFKISGKTPHCLVKQCHKLLSAKVLILGQAPSERLGAYGRTWRPEFEVHQFPDLSGAPPRRGPRAACPPVSRP